MEADKIIRQSMKLLGINVYDVDINTNHYYKMMTDELKDMRTQILEDFEFQIKQGRLAKLPEEQYGVSYNGCNKLLPYALPTDFMAFRTSGDNYVSDFRIKGSVIYMNENTNSIEYYSSDISYQDFPVYTEKYVVFSLVQRMSIYLGRDGNSFFQLAEL